MNKKNSVIKTRGLLFLFALTVLGLAYAYKSYVSFEVIQELSLSTTRIASAHPFITGLVLFTAQFLGMLASLPVKALINLLAAALLGFYAGSIITLVGVLAGTSCLFAAIRYFFRSRYKKLSFSFASKFTDKLEKHPVLAIAAMRLMVTLPYGPVTIVSALSNTKYRYFLTGTIIGDAPVILLYSAAGMQLHELASSSDALSPFSVGILVVASILLLVPVIFTPAEKNS